MVIIIVRSSMPLIIIIIIISINTIPLLRIIIISISILFFFPGLSFYGNPRDQTIPITTGQRMVLAARG